MKASNISKLKFLIILLLLLILIYFELDYRYKGDLFVFQNVPAGVCQQCGEKYLTAKVAKEIEHRIQTKKKWDKTISIPVDVLPKEIAA